MAGFGDTLEPGDDILAQLRRGRTADELPAIMQCPSGHLAHRRIDEGLDLGLEQPVPYWLCPGCSVTYRYSECRLRPGDEGAP